MAFYRVSTGGSSGGSLKGYISTKTKVAGATSVTFNDIPGKVKEITFTFRNTNGATVGVTEWSDTSTGKQIVNGLEYDCPSSSTNYRISSRTVSASGSSFTVYTPGANAPYTVRAMAIYE